MGNVSISGYIKHARNDGRSDERGRLPLLKAGSFLNTVGNEFRMARFSCFLNSVALTLGLKTGMGDYVLKNGLEVEFSPATTDLIVIRENLLNHQYSKFLTEKRLDTYVDLGAHKGYSILDLLSAGVRIGRALAVEPLPENCDALDRNLARNPALASRLGELVVERCAVARESGTRTLLVGRDPDASSLYDLTGHSELARKVEVPALTLADLFERHGIESVDYLKMDIQGAEHELFDSLQEDLILGTRYLSVEVHHLQTTTFVDIPTRLSEAGFSMRAPNPAWPDLVFAFK